jgi:hypothetical protein
LAQALGTSTWNKQGGQARLGERRTPNPALQSSILWSPANFTDRKQTASAPAATRWNSVQFRGGPPRKGKPSFGLAAARSKREGPSGRAGSRPALSATSIEGTRGRSSTGLEYRRSFGMAVRFCCPLPCGGDGQLAAQPVGSRPLLRRMQVRVLPPPPRSTRY